MLKLSPELKVRLVLNLSPELKVRLVLKISPELKVRLVLKLSPELKVRLVLKLSPELWLQIIGPDLQSWLLFFVFTVFVGNFPTLVIISVGKFPTLGKKCRQASNPWKNSVGYFPSHLFGQFPTLCVGKFQCSRNSLTVRLKKL